MRFFSVGPITTKALFILVLALARGAQGAEATPAATPAVEPRYEWEVMSGVLWKVGGGATPLNYVVLPQIISLKIPEKFYLGLAAAGELEWRHPSNRFEAFFASGGGFGWMDSEGYEIAGGQGQDFNLNWLVHTGIRYRTKSGWRWSAGAYFQHISNRGMNKINPGLNSLGPTLAVSRRF